MGTLTPKLSALPTNQLRLWNRLAATPADFVLYGGTALALRLGHRTSVDFDFFSRRTFNPAELVREIPYLRDQKITQESRSTLSCEVGSASEAVT
ncbi:MAG: nucleotidyl transferase AbiEii/AbiGii toxin family protein, partial [Steroidobacteraceae bacterium]